MQEAFKKGFESQLAVCGELATFLKEDKSFTTELMVIKVKNRDVLSQGQFSTYADATFLRVPCDQLEEIEEVIEGDTFTIDGDEFAVKGTPEKVHKIYWNVEVYEVESSD